MTVTDVAGVLPVRPALNAHFVLVIDGLATVSFSQCTGLGGEVGVEEYAEGGENRYVHRLPVRSTFGNLVLKQGAGPGLGLWHWWEEYRSLGRVQPRDGVVTLLTWDVGAPRPVRSWRFTRGWPVKMSGPDLDAQSAAVAIETMEIAHHGLKLMELF